MATKVDVVNSPDHWDGRVPHPITDEINRNPSTGYVPALYRTSGYGQERLRSHEQGSRTDQATQTANADCHSRVTRAELQRPESMSNTAAGKELSSLFCCHSNVTLKRLTSSARPTRDQGRRQMGCQQE